MTIRIPLDFSAVEEFEVLEGGVYSAVLEQMLWLEKQEHQKADQIQVKYTITEDDETKGTKMSQYLSFSPKALFRMRDFFDAFGADVEELVLDEADEGVAVILEPDLVGTPVELKITKERHYQDRKRWVNKVDAAQPLKSAKKAAPSRRTRDEDEEDESPAKRRGGRTIR